MMKKTTTIVLLVMLLLLLTGCADMLNTALGYENAYRKPVDGFEVYKLNTSYIMLVWNENRTDGEYSCSYSYHKYKTSNSRLVLNASSSYQYSFKVNYYKSNSDDNPRYSTDEKSPAEIQLPLVSNYDSTTGMASFSWSGLPEALMSHSNGLYIASSSSSHTESLSSVNGESLGVVSTGEYSTTNYSSSKDYYLFIQVGSYYYNIGQFTKQ